MAKGRDNRSSGESTSMTGLELSKGCTPRPSWAPGKGAKVRERAGEISSLGPQNWIVGCMFNELMGRDCDMNRGTNCIVGDFAF